MSHYTDAGLGIAAKVAAYVGENFLLGTAADVSGIPSLLEAGVLDSTGAMELVAWLEQEFGIVVADEDLVPENLDSVARICDFVARKLG